MCLTVYNFLSKKALANTTISKIGAFKSGNFQKYDLPKSDDDKDAQLLRGSTVNWLIEIDDEIAKNEAHALYDKYKDDLESLPANIRYAVLANEVKHHESVDLVDKFIGMYKQTNSSDFGTYPSSTGKY